MLKTRDISINYSVLKARGKRVLDDVICYCKNVVSHGVRRCNVVFTRKTCYKYMKTYATQSNFWQEFFSAMAENWKKLRLQMCFRGLLCVRIEIDPLLYVNCWLIIHCLSVNCTKINSSRCAHVILSSLQLASKQWIITEQFTARADHFLNDVTFTCWWRHLFSTCCCSIFIFPTGWYGDHVCEINRLHHWCSVWTG